MRWLHISDIHFGYDSATVEKMREKLIQKVEDIGPVNCLFITGDLRYGKTERTAYPPETLTFIQKLQETFGVKPEDTFVVPGNHDVNRGDVLQAGIEKAAQKYKTSDGTITEETLKYIRSQRQPFLDLYKEICGREEPDWHYCIQKDGFNIICLNTALFCCKDGEDGSLVVGSRLLNELEKKVDSSLPGIVLAHHDFEALRQNEQQQLELTLKEMGAELYLCGHKHVALARTQNTYRADRELNVFLCGTSMDKDPNLEQTDMDIFVGQIDKTGKKGFVQAYKWNYKCHDWLPDIDFSYPQNKATNGIRYFPADARPQPPKPLNKGILEKYCQYICAQCGEIDLNGLPTNQEDAGRKYALERIFVPLTLKGFKGRDEESVYEIPETILETEGDIEEWLASYRKMKSEVTLGELIPANGGFRRFVLSDPGGGKTTLLKRIASVYSMQEKCADREVFPQRELFPVWIRCRDIPVGSRLSVWNVIENVARLGEWAPGDSAAEDFIRLVSYHIERGTALLLIDGLDEIGSDADRRHFVDQLSIFADSNPSANMIVTTRITGFSVITRERFQSFEQFEISPLRKKGVEALCVKWYRIVYGESAESEEKARTLAERINGDERIFRLARNPLLLTTLLLVERRVGKLPTKRTALYDEAIQVLLETWNQAGHEHEKVDLEEAKYQLSYVAFHMMVNHTKRIEKTELHKLIREFRQNFSELVSQGEAVSGFIKKIEKRSALLIQKGYEETETGKTEEVYEFQHLTFQEYLAAYAVVNHCCPGQQEEDTCGAVLKPYLSDTTLKETVALAAILNRFCAKELADEIIERLASEVGFEEKAQLRALLLQFAADEVPLKDDVIDKIFVVCFREDLRRGDIKILRQILEGRYKDKLIGRFEQMDQERYGGYAHNTPISMILLKEVSDPYQYYMEHRLSTSFQQRVKAISVLGCAVWINSTYMFQELSEMQRSNLKEELFGFLESDNRYMRREALGILRMSYLQNTAEDISRYIEGCVKYINDFCELPPYLNELLLMRKMRDKEVKVHIPVNSDALQKVCAELRSKESDSMEKYEKLQGIALMAVIARADSECLTNIFSLLEEKKCDLVSYDQLLFGRLLHSDYTLSETLQRVMMCDLPQYTESQKKAVQKHILVTDLNSAQRMKRKMEDDEDDGVFSYNDCSLLDGSSFSLSYTENSLDEVIEYITKRLEALHMTSEVTC